VAPRRRRIPAAAWLLVITGLVWVGLRFVPWPSAPAPGADAFLDGVDVIPSADAGRFEIVRPTPDSRFDLIERHPEIARAFARLETRTHTVNNTLALSAERLLDHLIALDGGALAYFKWSDLVLAFHGDEAFRLTRAAREAEAHPLSFLRVFCAVGDERLTEPHHRADLDPGPLVTEAAARRELMLHLRDVLDTLDSAEAQLAAEVRQFHDASTLALRATPGIQRRGWARLAEAVLAGLLGAFASLTFGGAARHVPLGVTASLAAALATAALLVLEGTRVLPIDPAFGVSREFVPLGFAMGIAAALLSWLPPVGRTAVAPPHALPPAPPGPRSERELEVDRAAPASVPKAPVAPAPTPAAEPIQPIEPAAPERRPETLPFFPKRRR